jgi:WD40 repeat protein
VTHDDPVYAVAISPDGRHVLSVSGNADTGAETSLIWDAQTGGVISPIDAGGWPVSFSPDGKRVLLGSAAWDAYSGNKIADLPGNLVGFSSDARYVVSIDPGPVTLDSNFGTSHKQAVAIVQEANSGQEVARISVADAPRQSAVISLDGRYILFSGCELLDMDMHCSNGSAKVLEAQTGRQVFTRTYEPDIGSTALSPDGRYVALLDDAHKTASVWDVSTGIEATRVDKGKEWMDHPVFSPNSRYLVLAGTLGWYTGVWDVAVGKEVAEVDAGSVESVAMSPDGKYVAFGNDDGQVIILQTSPEAH